MLDVKEVDSEDRNGEKDGQEEDPTGTPESGFNPVPTS